MIWCGGIWGYISLSSSDDHCKDKEKLLGLEEPQSAPSPARFAGKLNPAFLNVRRGRHCVVPAATCWQSPVVVASGQARASLRINTQRVLPPICSVWKGVVCHALRHGNVKDSQEVDGTWPVN